MREYDEAPDEPWSWEPEPEPGSDSGSGPGWPYAGPRPLPSDASRLGFDRNTEEGALIALAASLDPAKLSHRVVAWVLLLAFAAPVVLSALHLLI